MIDFGLRLASQENRLWLADRHPALSAEWVGERSSKSSPVQRWGQHKLPCRLGIGPSSGVCWGLT